ncbi:mitochondrial carrier [Fragilariopsis cylindrus CCMP1102]|uniref:Mitochondrial carrier n=1 Tax=Fragilariopsis cylindrus CCMP1102 TaxID=635003 RepID=A0A1E7FLL9_9STRA|nr:mitochondrial carrier [Fragilariopsis cylindrus CCMP1102]|eukprot:OEU19027.1 mitochondrial carrier [Fragilariopsis cylindrus CCMP1102]
MELPVQQQQQQPEAAEAEFDDEWEEWDGISPFWVHCVAGSFAGVAEHVLVYPLDTVRTHIQVCAACHFNPATHNPSTQGVSHHAAAAAASTNAAARNSNKNIPGSILQKAAIMTRLWRGVQTILIGCIPAHALYFSTYEIVKSSTLDSKGNVTGYGSALAGGAAVIAHDIVLGPLDTVKQRLQLGHYRSFSHALTTMIKNEGPISLLRSFPITLATNIPYGMIMVGTNEFIKKQWTSNNANSNGVTLGASSFAGLVAAATTTPLDRIKTYLQTQQLTPSCLLSQQVANWKQAAIRIYRTEGYTGFFRGVTPRILSHTPAVAISWTTYETLKKLFTEHCA